MDKIEYKTLVYETTGFLGGKVKEDDLEGKLNELGEQGWDLVKVVTTNASSGDTRKIVCIFKRTIHRNYKTFQ